MLVNMTEYIVKERLESLMEDYPDICHCEKCRDDMLAIVLNQLPPQYVSTHKGELFKRIASNGMQKSVDLNIVILKAITLVSQSPQHEAEEA